MRVAIIGSGIGGISTAWLLSPHHEVDVYESEPQLGGHTHTIDLEVAGHPFRADSGFMVFNERTYPNLIRFFRHLGVEWIEADMSFSVQVRDEGVEWSGTNLDTVFAQRSNLANPAFLRMLAEVVRFSLAADRLLLDPATAELTLGELLQRDGYGRGFTDWYLIPMGSAIWSTPPGDMLDYPALTFLRFCDNHGLLHISGKPQWLSVKGGSRSYIEAAAPSFSGQTHVAEPVTRVTRTDASVVVETAKRTETYDAVVMACHPPQTREILGETMTDDERTVLGAFDYYPNDIVIHSDESFLPASKRAWASWNWFSQGSDLDKASLVLTYRLNSLQDIPADTPTVMETLNRDHDPAPGTVLAELSFDHPMYTGEAIAAQSRLGQIQGADRIWYAGAWTRYGFHEDGMLSGVRIADAMGVPIPWADELDETHTRVIERV